MRIAIAVTEFPVLSQTFVLDHMTGLLERGHAVDVHARRRGRDGIQHAEVAGRDLLAYCHAAPPVPRGRWAAFVDGWHRGQYALLRRPGLALSLWQRGEPGFWSRFYNALSLWDRVDDYTALHAHSGPNGLRLLPLFTAGHLRCRLVVTFHGHDVHGYLQGRPTSLYTDLFRRADALVVCSEFMRTRLLELGAPAAKLRLIPNAIAAERYAWRPRIAKPASQPTELLCVGRLVAFKGLGVLLDALANPSLARSRLKLHIVGDGPLRETLLAQAIAKGLQTRVTFHGALPRESVLALMNKCDLYVAPAIVDVEGNTETQGVALLEAMACGLPVIASSVGGIPETLDAAAAALVEPGNAEALAAAIGEQLSRSALWADYSHLGRERVLAHFQPRAWLDQLEAMYRSPHAT